MLTLFAFAGCGTGGDKAQEEATPEGEQAAEQPKEKITIRIAGQNPIEHSSTQSLYTIEKTVEEKSGGRIQIDVYPANQLGDYTLVYEELMKGTIDMALISVAPTYDNRMLLSYMPYIAENYETIKKLYAPNGFMYNTYKEVHGALNVEFLGFYGEGLGGVGSTKMPKEPMNPKVDKGILLRVPGIDSLKLCAEDMGYRTTSIPYADVYTSMQTGVCDAWIGGPASLNWHGFRDVIKYYLETNDFYECTFFLMNKDLWNRLDAEAQQIIKDAVETESLRSFEVNEEENEKYMKQMEEYGINVIRFSDEELKTMANYIRETTWPKVAEKIGKDVVEGLKAQY